jgi:hypothetical protein
MFINCLRVVFLIGLLIYTLSLRFKLFYTYNSYYIVLLNSATLACYITDVI